MSGNDGRETEWQFDALDLRPVTRWLEASDELPEGFSVTKSSEKQLHDRYLDTARRDFFRAGYALRIRAKGDSSEATIKGLEAQDSSGAKVREEISSLLESPDLSFLTTSEGEVGERLRSLCASRQPEELFSVKTARRVFELRRSDGDSSASASAEIALDETEIPVPGGDSVLLKRVEVELESGSPEDFAPFISVLSERFMLTRSAASKFEAGAMSNGVSFPERPEFGSTGRTAEMPAGEYAFAILREQFVELLAREPGARVGADPEELHDMRVAIRRMRAAVKLFRGALPARAAHFGRELKWVAGFLGGVRDLDVQISQIERWAEDAPPEDAPAFVELEAALFASRGKARRAMLRSLESRRYERFVDSFGAFLRRGPSRRAAGARVPAAVSGSVGVRKVHRKFRKQGDGISPSSAAEAYHDLRKLGKRLRYALEFMSPVYGERGKAVISSLKTVQDVLGEHQDAEVAVGKLREFAPEKRVAGGLSPRTCFVMGTIAARYDREAAELRKRFPKVYSGIGGKAWKRLGRAIERGRADTDG